MSVQDRLHSKPHSFSVGPHTQTIWETRRVYPTWKLVNLLSVRAEGLTLLNNTLSLFIITEKASAQERKCQFRFIITFKEFSCETKKTKKTRPLSRRVLVSQCMSRRFTQISKTRLKYPYRNLIEP